MRGEEEAYLARPPLPHSHNRTAACRASYTIPPPFLFLFCPLSIIYVFIFKF